MDPVQALTVTAAARARLKKCLASIDVEPCGLNRGGRMLCATNEARPDPQANLTPPGAAQAERADRRKRK